MYVNDNLPGVYLRRNSFVAMWAAGSGIDAIVRHQRSWQVKEECSILKISSAMLLMRRENPPGAERGETPSCAALILQQSIGAD
jgi:hypothetical protein